MPRAMTAGRVLAACVVAGVAALAFSGTVLAETWRGLTVAPEHRCAPYDRNRDYRYPQSIEREIVRRLGAVYGPYTGACFSSMSETDIEHMVATSEAHDSGLCAADRATRARFATDPSQPYACLAGGEPPSPQERQGRRGMAAGAQPLLVRGPGRRGAPRLRPHHRPARGRRPWTGFSSGCASTEMKSVVCSAPTVSDRERGTGPLPDVDANGRRTRPY